MNYEQNPPKSAPGPQLVSAEIGRLLGEGGALADLRLLEEMRLKTLLDAQQGALRAARSPNARPLDVDTANNVNHALLESSQIVANLNRLANPDD